MKSYKFRLEKVLDWKEIKEETAAQKFAQLQNELKKQKSVLENLLAEYKILKKEGLKLKNIHELKQHNLYDQTMEKQITQQKETTYMISRELSEAKSILIKAQKDKKIVEKLKEKDFEVYKEDMKKEEQKELDEIGVLRYNALLEGR